MTCCIIGKNNVLRWQYWRWNVDLEITPEVIHELETFRSSMHKTIHAIRLGKLWRTMFWNRKYQLLVHFVDKRKQFHCYVETAIKITVKYRAVFNCWQPPFQTRTDFLCFPQRNWKTLKGHFLERRFVVCHLTKKWKVWQRLVSKCSREHLRTEIKCLFVTFECALLYEYPREPLPEAHIMWNQTLHEYKERL